MPRALSQTKLVEIYIDFVLTENQKPGSIYSFMKMNGFKEAQFYEFFGSFNHIEQHTFSMFFDQTLKLLKKDSNYAEYDSTNKLLSFYFTFFEILTANRSFVMYVLNSNKNPLDSISTLSEVRSQFKHLIHEIELKSMLTAKEPFSRIGEAGLKEGAWVQFLSIMKFWMDDSSPSFEKTDVYIEKTVRALAEVLAITPLDSVIDLGKFLFKEKVQF